MSNDNHEMNEATPKELKSVVYLFLTVVTFIVLTLVCGISMIVTFLIR
jgi:hypothetical protein